MNILLATKVKFTVASALVSLAFVSQASALLRPLFPIKPAAPSNGELIVIGDEFMLRMRKNGVASPGQAQQPVPGENVRLVRKVTRAFLAMAKPGM